jgi:hypothetical protein
MKCWSQESIGQAAIWMADAGIAPGCAPGAAVTPDLVALIEHAQTCVRCRDLLRREFDAEILLRARGRNPVVLPLAPVDPSRPVFPGSLEETPGRLGSYPLAAQTPGSGSHAEEGVRPTCVLTLTTSDGRFIVRIFPNEPGPGATAILYPTRLGATIEIDGMRYAFGEDGSAALPGFPGADISLVLH